MIAVFILEESDIIKSTDYCRPLQLISRSGGHSDHYSFNSPYSGAPENNVRWTKVSQVLGDCWYGKTIKEFQDNIDLKYEFIRGNIPDSHLYGKTRAELRQDYDTYLKTTVMPYGKYREMLLYDLVQAYPDYAIWAENKGIIKSSRDFYYD